MADYTDNILLDTPPPTQNDTVDVGYDPMGNVTGVPPQVASTRASLANYGLQGIVDKPVDYIRDMITRGREPELRQEAAATLDEKKSVDKQQQIQDIASQPLTPDTKAKLFDVINKPIKPTDPNSVFEDSTALKYVNSIYTVNANPEGPKFTWLKEVEATNPLLLQDTTDLAAEAISKYMFWQNKAQEMQSRLGEQPLVSLTQGDYSKVPTAGLYGRIPDMLKQALFVYPELMLRGNVEGSGFFDGGLLGGNLEAQRAKLYGMDYDTMKQKGSAILERLSQADLSMAAKFAQAMVGQSMAEHTLDNVFSVAAPFEVAQGVSILYRGTRQLGKNLVMNAPNFYKQPPSVVAATGVGDLGEAAIQKVALNKVGDLAGHTDETKRAIESLTNNFNIINQEWHANPGNNGTAFANVLTESLEASRNNLVEAITTLQRVNRTPVATTVDDVVRMVKDNIRGEAKSINSAILDVKGPFPEPVSNVPYYELHIGTNNKEFFKDWQTAEGFAKTNNIPIIPRVSQEFNRLNQAIAAARKAGKDILPLQAERNAFQVQYKELLKDKNALMPMMQGATIENNGSGAGFYLKIVKANPEKIDVVRNTLITPEAPNISTYKQEIQKVAGPVSTSLPLYTRFLPDTVSSAISRLRTPEETLSAQERVSRNIVDNGPKRLVKLFEQTGKPIRDLNVSGITDGKDFERILVFGQHKIDPDTGLPGYFFKNAAELEYAYMQNFKRLPHQQEIAAYHSYVKLMEYDRILREMGSYRNKAINGVEQVQFKLGNLPSGFFEATRHPNFPGGDATIAFINPKGKVDVFSADTLGSVNRKFHDNQVKAFNEGRTEVWKIWDTDSMPLRNLSLQLEDKHVEYVIVPKGSEVKPLSWNTIPRRGGGHLTPDYDHYIKQPIVFRENVNIGKGENRVRDIYRGDRTIMPIDVRAKGDNIAKGMNDVRIQLAKGDEAAARQAHLDHKLPMDWDEHLSWYKEGRTPSGEKIPPRLDPKHEIRTVPKDKMIVDLDNNLEKSFQYLDKDGKPGNTFKDGTRGGNPSRLASIEFTGQRDAYEMMTIGDGGRGATKNPLYSYQPVQYIDPITAMDSGLARIANSTFMDDYKAFVAEHWLEQAKDYLDVKGGLAAIRANPLHHFHNYKLKDGVPWEVKTILEGAHLRAMDFIGRASPVDAAMHSFTTKLADATYKMGAGSKAATAIVSLGELPLVRNPISFMRSAVTHLALGWYNIRSFANQLGTFVNITAISPRHAPAGSFATVLFALSKINRTEEILNYMDKLASKLSVVPSPLQASFKPGEWKEATKLLWESGLNIVGGEHAFLDTKVNVNIGRGWFDKLQAGGMKPFEYGAKATKVAAWYTAYLELRDAKPLTTLTREDKEWLVSRTSLLDHNMTRSANSAVHTGVWAVPMQFQSYSIRTSELVFGKRLTPGEKTRLIGAASLMYGIPVGALGTAGIALNNTIRENMLDKGVPIGGAMGDYLQKTLGTQPYVVGDNLMVTLGMEGMLAFMLATATGGGNPRKGTWYDTSRFASKGVDLITNLWSDKSYLEIATGMIGSTFKNISTQSSGLMRFLGGIVESDNAKKYEFTSQDVMDLANIVNEGDALRELITALNIQKFISRTGTFTGDATPSQAWIKHILGVSPVHIQSFPYTEVEKATRQNEDSAGKEMNRQFTRFLINDETGNKEEAAKNYRNMMRLPEIVDMRSDRRLHFIEQAEQGQVSQFLRVRLDFYTKYSKDKEFDSKMQALQKELQLRGQK